MSLFGIEAPTFQVYGDSSMVDPNALSPKKRKLYDRTNYLRTKKQAEANLVFRGLVGTILSRTMEKVEVEEAVLSTGQTVVTSTLSCDQKTLLSDGHEYAMAVSTVHFPKTPQNVLLHSINVSQWSPGGESDGSLHYESPANAEVTTRRYLGGLVGIGEAELAEFARMEHELSPPMPMDLKAINHLQNSIATLYPELNLLRA